MGRRGHRAREGEPDSTGTTARSPRTGSRARTQPGWAIAAERTRNEPSPNRARDDPWRDFGRMTDPQDAIDAAADATCRTRPSGSGPPAKSGWHSLHRRRPQRPGLLCHGKELVETADLDVRQQRTAGHATTRNRSASEGPRGTRPLMRERLRGRWMVECTAAIRHLRCVSMRTEDVPTYIVPGVVHAPQVHRCWCMSNAEPRRVHAPKTTRKRPHLRLRRRATITVCIYLGTAVAGRWTASRRQRGPDGRLRVLAGRGRHRRHR